MFNLTCENRSLSPAFNSPLINTRISCSELWSLDFSAVLHDVYTNHDLTKMTTIIPAQEETTRCHCFYVYGAHGPAGCHMVTSCHFNKDD